MNILAYIILVVVLCSIFFFIDTASTEIYTLSLHDALPICFRPIMMTTMAALLGAVPLALGTGTGSELRHPRSEEHRLNSSHRCISYAVFCLKKKTQKHHALFCHIPPNPHRPDTDTFRGSVG